MKQREHFGLNLVLAVLFTVSLILQSGGFVRAEINSCVANMSPATVRPNAEVTYSLGITNSGPDSIVWLQILRPSTNYIITSAAWAGSSSIGDDQATLYDGVTTTAGDTTTINITVRAGEDQTSDESWTVLAADNSGGSGAVACAGNLTSSVAGERVPDPDITPPIISDIRLSKLKINAITVSWSTDEPSDSDINYGQTTDYGQNVHATALVTSHSLELIGLEPDTSYHFNIITYDALGNGIGSDDNTFLTPSVGSLPPPIISTTPPTVTKIPLKATPSEKIPPTVSITTSLQTPFKETPVITGTAADNETLANIDYSLDGGINWLQISTVPGLGTQKATFSFTPQNLQDGNYSLIVRAMDTSSNIASTKAQTLIIDRLPPTVGGTVITVGSQAVAPNKDNVMSSIVGVDQKITLSAVGGPTSVSVVTTKLGKTAPAQSFTLTQSADDGLWSGILSYSKVGGYQLTVHAIDGAGNTTSRLLATVQVGQAGQILGADNKPVAAKITIYTRDSETNSWVLWDGEAYDQTNPLVISARHGYGLFIPQGTYYLKIEANGYQPIITNSFTQKSAAPINESFTLKRKSGLDFGPIHIHLSLPILSGRTLDTSTSSPLGNKSTILDTAIPQFRLKLANGKTVNTADLYGKPTILTFINTWSGTANNQFTILDDLSVPFANIFAVSSGESVSRLSSYIQLAGYSTPVLVDSDNKLIDKLGGSYIPQTYFIDRHGVVKKVMVGVLSKEELIKNITL